MRLVCFDVPVPVPVTVLQRRLAVFAVADSERVDGPVSAETFRLHPVPEVGSIRTLHSAMTRLAHADDMMATPREQRRGMQLEIAAGLARLLSAQSSSENASSAGTALGVPCQRGFHLACCKLHPIWHASAVRHETRE